MRISQFIETDVLVIGSGGAGLTAATVAAAEGARVCLVSKDPIAGGDTKIAEGNITVVGSGSPKDTRDELVSNMRLQGDDISDPAIVEAFADDSQAAYKWLRQAGMRPQLNHKGKPKTQPIPLGGHTKARTVRHEQKGRDFSSVLRNAFMASGDHHWIEDAWALDLIMAGNRATGALVYHAAAGEFIAFSARATVLACGGANTIFFITSDPIWNQGFMDRVELENMLTVAAAIAQSAQCRTYSLGAHVRTDRSPGKGSTGTPGSVRIKGRTSDSLTIDWVPRSRTAFRERLRFNIRQGVKITALKFLSRLPESGRDKIQLALLKKISQKLEG